METSPNESLTTPSFSMPSMTPRERERVTLGIKQKKNQELQQWREMEADLRNLHTFLNPSFVTTTYRSASISMNYTRSMPADLTTN